MISPAITDIMRHNRHYENILGLRVGIERRWVIELVRSGERTTCRTVQYQDNKFNTLIINFIQNFFGKEDCILIVID